MATGYLGSSLKSTSNLSISAAVYNHDKMHIILHNYHFIQKIYNLEFELTMPLVAVEIPIYCFTCLAALLLRLRVNTPVLSSSSLSNLLLASSAMCISRDKSSTPANLINVNMDNRINIEIEVLFASTKNRSIITALKYLAGTLQQNNVGIIKLPNKTSMHMI
jgi:hypothetical protein